MPYAASMPLEEQRRRSKERNRKWYQKNREAILARQKAYNENPEIRERNNSYRQKWAAENREKVRRHYRTKNWKNQGCPSPSRPEPTTCECCGKADRRALALDHCHETGVFRGWLCSRCNLGLGQLGDTIDSLQRALDYLKRSQ